MTTLYQEIRGALQVQALAVSGFPSSVDYEGVLFTSTVGTPYARLRLLPQLDRPYSVSAGQKRHDGLFQVDLFYPANAGTADVESAADAVRDSFAAATHLVAGADVVAVDYAERGPTLQPPDWIHVPVTVKWHCFSPRN